MAIPFYNQVDQDIYAGGEHYIPQEQYRLNYTPSTALASTVGGTGGVTGTQAANPYLYPQGGGGGGGGGIDLGRTKDFRKAQYTDGSWSMQDIKGYWSPSGWKTAEGKNIEHAGLFTGDPKEGDIEATEMDFSSFPSPLNFIRTKLRNWQKNKEIKKAEEIAQQKVEREQTIKDYSTWKSPSGRDHEGTGGIGSPESKKGAAPGQPGASKDWRAQGGRIGYRTAGPVFGHDEPSEPILDFMQDQGVPFSEQVEAGPTEEQVAMVIDMDGRGMGIDEIMSFTQLGKETIMNILGVEMAQGGIASLV
jgi:hypothetical protein